MQERTLDTVESAIEAIKAGKLVIVVDDEDRENEGDFITAAANANPEVVNFMAKEGRGLICAPITEARAEALQLDLMVGKNTVLHETQFTVSVDLLKDGVTTGSKSLTSHAKCVLNKEASNLVIGPAPDLPASRFFQVSSVELPSGVSAPKPVTTTRLRLINKTLVYPFASSIYEIA